MEFGFEIEEVTGNEVVSIRENSISDGLVQRERLRQVFMLMFWNIRQRSLETLNFRDIDCIIQYENHGKWSGWFETAQSF